MTSSSPAGALAPYRHYGWELSLYSGKTRAYLRHKGLPFDEKICTVRDMARIRKKTGATVMPVLVTPQGEWLQDTSHIIDTLEQRHPQRAMLPDTPRQRLVSYLLEAWGDEFWLPPAMHYRWSFPENFREQFAPEAGRQLLPWAPRMVQQMLAKRLAGTLRGFCSGLGVRSGQTRLIEQWTEHMCDVLDAHFARHDYLLGSRPSLGDFGLIAPLYAHLGRDPYPRRTLVAPRPHLAEWIRRMQHPPADTGGEWMADDGIPDTLAPVLEALVREFGAYLRATIAAIPAAAAAVVPGRGLPRALGDVDIPYGGASFRLQGRPFSVWMAQRALPTWQSLPADGRTAVCASGLPAGCAELLDDLDHAPTLRRRALWIFVD
ncbi:MAG: glutathione S-transferase family protein [Oceanococcaceae bacterium]